MSFLFFFLGASFPTRFSHTTAFPFFPFLNKITPQGSRHQHQAQPALSRRRAPVTCKSITRPTPKRRPIANSWPSSIPAPEAPEAAASLWRLQSRRTWRGAGSGGTAWTRSFTSFGATLGRVVDFTQLGFSKLRDTSRWSFCSLR